MTDSFVKKAFTVPSTDGIHTLSGVIYEPIGEKKAILHIVHGMCEYMERYDRFMSKMAREGYVVCGYNHLGHKGTSPDTELGFIAEKGGATLLPRDVHAFGEQVKAAYPARPYILMGHSMGSFVVRLTASLYPDFANALIVMGTGGPNGAAGIGLALTALLKAFGGGRKVSKLIYFLAFGSYNSKTEKRTDSDWLTHDREIIDRYRQDPYCMFPFTVSAMDDLIRMNRDSNRRSCYEKYPAALPILLIAGEQDPVGNYGKGVTRVAKALGAAGKTVTTRLYPGMRHEILNETDRDAVEQDLLAFCNSILIP